MIHSYIMQEIFHELSQKGGGGGGGWWWGEGEEGKKRNHADVLTCTPFFISYFISAL